MDGTSVCPKSCMPSKVLLPRKINVLLGWSGAIWQEEFFDHALRSNDSLAEKLITFVRIPCERGWSKLRVSIVGSGGVPFRFSSGERHSGLLGRLTGSETRSHTDSGNHAVSAFRYISLGRCLGNMSPAVALR